MAEYKIQAVSDNVRQYDTKFGPMISYKLKLVGVETPVELGQKSTTQPPQEGQTLNGYIEDTQYGKKFKKEQVQSFGGSTGGFPQASPAPTSPQGGATRTSKFDSDPFTMYLSYAKDVAVALIGSKEGFSVEKFALILDEVIVGGKTLYDNRPGAEPHSSEPTDQDHVDAIKLFDLEPDTDRSPTDF